MKKTLVIIFIQFLLGVSLIFSHFTYAGVFNGSRITPQSYIVTVKKVEFKNDKGQYVLFDEADALFGIAAGTANTKVGNYGENQPFPNGRYTQMRTTFSRIFGMKFAGTDRGESCRTKAGGGKDGAISAEGISGVSKGSSDGGDAELQQVSIPQGSKAAQALKTAGFTEEGGDLQILTPVNFQVDDNTPLPALDIKIDLKDSASMYSAEGCHVIPEPPSVRVGVGD